MKLDISQPLSRGRTIRMGGSKTGWVDFRYERLPIFCYWCRRIDHDDRDSPLWINSKESLGSKDKQFGPWLRADSEHLQRPMVTEVDKQKPSESNRGGKSSGKVNEQPRIVFKSRPTMAAKSYSGETDP
ncbi:hypothetical protein CFP56_038985 [Quercus suber]|uniref:Zinc knuckle CX2CX4HX4C domain-containing protein n=1 Tax=Quercus suber TaxID=58331 RepID=A0AAW0J0P4_QUESU